MNWIETTRQKIEQSSIILLVILVVLGTFLRVYQLNTGLWFDEIQTVLESIRNPLYEIVTTYPGNNDHPFYSVLANISITVFGEQPWSVRLPAVLFGIASIPMLYLVGTASSNRFEALLATVILTVSYHHIWFSQNARGYTGLLFFVLLATYLLIQWLSNKQNLNIIGYAIVAAFGSYTHLTMVFVVLTHAVICIWVLSYERLKANELRSWQPPVAAFLLGGFLTIVLYSPLIIDMTDFFTQTAHTAETKEVATPVWAIIAAIRGLQIGFGAIGAVAFGGLIFVAGALSYFKNRPSVFFLFLLPAPVTLLLGITMGRPIFPRFIFFVIGFGLLIVIRGAVIIGEWVGKRINKKNLSSCYGTALAVVLTIAAIAVSVRSLPYGYAYPKQDYQSAIDFAIENQKTDEIIAVSGFTTALPIQEYFGKPWLRVDSKKQLILALSKGTSLLQIFTFTEYFKTGQPEFWETIQKNCKELGEFEGTIAGGNIYVYRCESLVDQGR